MPRITLTSPSGQRITLTPPPSATPEDLQRGVDSVIAQFNDAGAQLGTSSSTSTPTTPKPLGQAAWESLSRGGHEVEGAVRSLFAEPGADLATLSNLATVATPIIAPGATAAGLGTETVARRLGAGEQGARAANTTGQLGAAAAPLAAATAGRFLSHVPGLGPAAYRGAFSQQAKRSYGALTHGDFPRESGRFIPYMKAATLDESTLLRRAASGDSKLINAFNYIMEVGLGASIGGAAGHPVVGAVLGRMVGKPALEMSGKLLTAALTNPVTAPLTRHLLSSSTSAPDYARLASVLAQHLSSLSSPAASLDAEAESPEP